MTIYTIILKGQHFDNSLSMIKEHITLLSRPVNLRTLFASLSLGL